MRTLLATLALVVSATAAPVPKSLKRDCPLSVNLRPGKDSRDVTVEVVNHTGEDVAWEYSTSPVASFEVEVFDREGLRLETIHPDSFRSPFSPARRMRVAPGDSVAFHFSLDLCFRDAKAPAGPLKVRLTFRHDGRRYESAALKVQ